MGLLTINVTKNGIEIIPSPLAIEIKGHRPSQQDKLTRHIVRSFVGPTLHNLEYKIVEALRKFHKQDVSRTEEAA